MAEDGFSEAGAEQVVGSDEQPSEAEIARRKELLCIGKSVLVLVQGANRIGVVRYVGEALFHPG